VAFSDIFDVIGALNNKTGKVFRLFCEKIDSIAFLKFLKKLLKYYKKIFLILDNASWHKSKLIKNFVYENKERIRLEFLPPYSPEYNPSEQCWKNVKRDLLTSKMFFSLEGMKDQIDSYFEKKRFSNLKLERFLCP